MSIPNTERTEIGLTLCTTCDCVKHENIAISKVCRQFASAFVPYITETFYEQIFIADI